LKITILGLAITSSWGNGHATTYRALARALHARGHQIVFFERNLEWYASNRDMPEPPFCVVYIYDRWDDILPKVRRELASSDVAIVGSYFPDALAAIEEVFDSRVGIKAFYDIDTPITVAALDAGGAEYLKPEHVTGFDIYFSFTGGPALRKLESKFGAQRAVPLYCSFDVGNNQLSTSQSRFASDLSFMGTYAPDRQSNLEELFCKPARALPEKRFLIAGPQYPSQIKWPANVRQIIHLEPRLHVPFYCSSRLTLNLTRREMVAAGYSPSVRLFEAAGCGATIASDRWPGLETFFTPGEEILLPDSNQDVIGYLTEMYETEMKAIGWRAQERVLREHGSERRAIQFEEYVSLAEASPMHTSVIAEPSL
jgi:spore maturation protein CgeB